MKLREPFFKQEQFFTDLSSLSDRENVAKQANRLVAPLIISAENNRFMVECLLPQAEKLLEENERLKTCLFQMQNAAQDLVRQLDTLKAEAERLKAKLGRTKGHMQRRLEEEEMVNSKIYEELLEENERLRAEVETWKAKYVEARKSGYLEGREEAERLRSEIEQAPVVWLYESSSGWRTSDDELEGVRYFKARLVRIEEVGK